jgi:replication initiation protein RepC
LPTYPRYHLPGQILAAFKAAAPHLGLVPRLVHTIDWLFRFTQPQDWETGAQPIVWPSAAVQRDALGLSETQVRVLNRALIGADLITMKDGPNGKRYGKQDSEGCIIEALGSICLRLRCGMRSLAAAAKAERVEMAQLRRRAMIACKRALSSLSLLAALAVRRLSPPRSV